MFQTAMVTMMVTDQLLNIMVNDRTMSVCHSNNIIAFYTTGFRKKSSILVCVMSAALCVMLSSRLKNHEWKRLVRLAFRSRRIHVHLFFAGGRT